jgi:hypothetical protein
MESKKTIVVNGKQYDAATGAIVRNVQAVRLHRGQNIDGFFRSRTAPKPASQTPPISDSITVLAAPVPAPKPHKQPNRNVNHAKHHIPQSAKTVAIRVRSDVQHSQKLPVHRTLIALNHTNAVAPQSSKTLMRTAVKRPDPSFYKQAHTKATLQHAVPSLIVPKQAIGSIDPSRLVRAQSVKRSSIISRHASKSEAIHPLLMPLAVHAAPADPRPQEQVPPTTPSPMPTNKPADIFEHALANANHFVDIQAHKAHYRKKARRHVASMAAGTLALLIVATFAFYQNSPGLQFKVAGYHAGIVTHMPNFKAAGFAYEGVKAGYGKLDIGFSNTSGSFKLSQQNTNLTSRDVISSLGATDASGHPDYTTVQAGNTTVYRFSNTDATWVQNGTWYTVNGTGPLSDTQVKSLVRNI